MGFINLSGVPFWRGIIPVVNVYYLSKALQINLVYIIILALCIIFLPIRMLFVTMIFVTRINSLDIYYYLENLCL